MLLLAVGVVIFIAGVVVGALLAGLYPQSRDRLFQEYLRREYGGKT